jgi:hypothetical protein
LRSLKKAYRRAQTLKRSTAQDPEKRTVRREDIEAAHAAYLGLAEVIDFPVLPKKGKCSAAERAREGDPRVIQLRRKHAAGESAINPLEVHGLDRCRDHGIDGFKRYVALAVMARNIQRIGALLLAQEAEEARRERERQRRCAG